MRRTDLSLGLAVVLLLGAAGLALTPTYAESATLCGSVADPGLPLATRDAFCEGLVDGRAQQVLGCAAVALALLVVALLVRRHDASATEEEPSPATWLVGLLAPLPAAALLVLITASEEEFDGASVSSAFLLAAGALGVLSAVGVAVSRGLHRPHALAAAAGSLPLVWAATCLPAARGRSFLDSERPVVLSLDDRVVSPWYLLAGVPVALALVAALAWQDAGRDAPAPWLSWLAMGVSGALSTVAFGLGLVPGTTAQGGAFGVVLVGVPAVLVAAAWIGVATSSRSERVEAS